MHSGFFRLSLPTAAARLAFLFSALLSPAAAAAPAAPASSAAAAPESPRCAARLDSLERLHEADRAEYLAWDFASLGCSQGQLYQAYRRQGFGSLLVGDWQAAALYLGLAKEIGGPADEELLYHLWTAWRRLDSRPEMLAMTRELYARFPASPYLARVLDEWNEVEKPRTLGWKGSFETRLARNRLGSLDQDLSNRLRGELRHAAGSHRFRGSAALSLKGNLGQRALEGFQMNLGAEWQAEQAGRAGGFSLDADWGLGYDAASAKDTLVSALSGTGGGLQYAGWNGHMAQLNAGWLGGGPGAASLAIRAGVRLLAKDWWAAGATASPAWSSGAWSLTALLDVQHHVMSWEARSQEDLEGTGPVTLVYAMDGMQTLQASLSPGRRIGAHDFELGLGYFLVRYASTLTLAYGGLAEAERDHAWEHALALSPSWRWSLSRRLRFDLGAGFGYDFEERGASVPTCREWLPGYCAEESYGADAGFSLAF